jgi:hypothetical protein
MTLVGAARARPGATLVALVTTDPSADLSHRVQEQLAALGFDVVVLNPPASGSVGPAALEQAARNVGAIAAIRLVPLAQSVQVWTADPVTGQFVFRELVPPAGQSPSDASVALGAVELLRASLLELHPPPPPPPPPPPIERPVLRHPAEEKPYQPRFGIAAGPGVDLGLAGRPGVDLHVAAWVGLAGRFGLRAIAIATVSPAEISNSPSDIDVSSQLYGAELTYDLMPASSFLVPVVGLGMAVGDVTVRGEASPAQTNLLNLNADHVVGLPFAHAGLSWMPTHGVRVRADGMVGPSVPFVKICLISSTTGQCEEVAGYWGRPHANVSLAVEVLVSP